MAGITILDRMTLLSSRVLLSSVRVDVPVDAETEENRAKEGGLRLFCNPSIGGASCRDASNGGTADRRLKDCTADGRTDSLSESCPD